MNRLAVEGFLDAFLFLTIISVAYCIVFSSTSLYTDRDEYERNEAAVRYAASSLDAILTSTMLDAAFTDLDGENVRLANGTTVKEFLMDETYLVSSGWPLSSFEDGNERILSLLRRVIVPAFSPMLVTGISDVDSRETLITIGNPVPVVGFAACRTYYLLGISIEIKLALSWT